MSDPEKTRVSIEDPPKNVRPPLEEPIIRAPPEKLRPPVEDQRMRAPLDDQRIRSPTEKIRPPPRSDWHQDPYLSPDEYVQEKRPVQSLRSLSPTELIRSQRIMDGYRRGGSTERAVYNRRVYDDDRSPSPPPPPPRFRKWSHVDEEVSYREERIPREAFTDGRGKYIMPEYEDSYGGGINPKVKHFGGSGSSGSRYDQVKHIQGTERSWQHMPPQVVGPRSGRVLASSSSGNSNIRLREDDEDLRFREKLHTDKVSMEEYYEGNYDPHLYAEDAYDPVMVSTRPREFRRVPAEVSKDRLRALSKEYLPSYRVGRRREKYELEDRDGYSEAPPHFAKGPVVHLNDRFYNHDTVTSVRREPREYIHHDDGRREEDRVGVRTELYRQEDEPNQRRAYTHRGTIRPRLPGTVVDEVLYVERSSKIFRESNSRVHHPPQEERLSNYKSIKSGPIRADHDGEITGSGINSFGVKPSRESERNHLIGGDYGFGRDAGPLSQKERLKRMQISESDPGMYRKSVSPRRRLRTDELSVYEPSERLLKRRYPVDQEVSRYNDRSILLSDRITSRQVQELDSGEEQWIDEKEGGLFSSKRLRLSHVPYRKSGRPYEGRIISQLSESDDWSSYNDVPEDEQMNRVDHYTNADGMNIKERLRPRPSDYHNSHAVGRRQDYYKSDRPWKRNVDNEIDVVPTDDDNLFDDMDAPSHDLPEDSDEFKQQVENLFLQYCKVLNTKPSTQRRYREEGNAGFLLCIVCGRLSKEFQDTRSLVTHTFMSRKLGKRAHHLALNKAICVLMGWKSIVIPTGACVYEVLPIPEAAALKEDLILWPPFVIIHNSSVLNGNPHPQDITTEQIEAILRGMGFSGGKTKVRYGKSANQSIILVKFLPTFSGLQEAEKLHNYYIENIRERDEFQKLKAKRIVTTDEAGEKSEVIVENLLYGYLAIAEDLDKLDFDSKKKCVVKSKKNIQAIADAPLKSD